MKKGATLIKVIAQNSPRTNKNTKKIFIYIVSLIRKKKDEGTRQTRDYQLVWFLSVTGDILPCFCQVRIQTQAKIIPEFTFNLLRSSFSLLCIIQLESTKAHKLGNIWSFKDLGWNCLWNPWLNEEEEAAILDRLFPSQLIEPGWAHGSDCVNDNSFLINFSLECEGFIIFTICRWLSLLCLSYGMVEQESRIWQAMQP